jgi:hypothetical protein
VRVGGGENELFARLTRDPKLTLTRTRTRTRTLNLGFLHALHP